MDNKVYDSYGASLRSGIREIYGVDGSGFSTTVFNDGGRLTMMVVPPCVIGNGL